MMMASEETTARGSPSTTSDAVKPAEESYSLWEVAKAGNWKQALPFLDKAGEAAVHDRDMSGNSILHWFSLQGNVEAIRNLVERGADVNAVNQSMQTPLFFAVMQVRPRSLHSCLISELN